MRVVIRRARPGSEAAWKAAVERIISSGERDGELISYAESEAALGDDRCYMLLAESEGAAIGLLTAYRFPDLKAGGSLVYLYDIEVVEPVRRQGVGVRLLRELIRLCDADGVGLIWAGTESDNLAARKAFESTGGKLEGESYAEYEWELQD